jgi:uncharacterized membrane protein
MNQQLTLDQRTADGKNTARMLYLVHAATFFFSLGLLSIIPVIINYSKLAETQGTMVYSHHQWMIRSFWWYMVWMVVGGALLLTFIGIPIAIAVWGIAWLWKAYRLIRGFVDLNANTPMPT